MGMCYIVIARIASGLDREETKRVPAKNRGSNVNLMLHSNLAVDQVVPQRGLVGFRKRSFVWTYVTRLELNLFGD